MIGIASFNPRRAGYRLFIGQYTPSGTVIPYIWKKPPNAEMVSFLIIGSGAGGGGGFTRTAGSNSGGGAGGGSGGIARLIAPACLVPSVLFFNVPLGGPGGAANTTGSAGGLTSIGTVPSSVAAGTLVLVSGAAAAAGGAGGATGTGSAIAGAAGTIATAAGAAFSSIGIWQAIAGQAAVAGGPSTADGVALTWGATGIGISGGTGGGGASSANLVRSGGALTGVGLITSLIGGVGVINNGGAGQTGRDFWPGSTMGGSIIGSTGGTGGGCASTTGTGGIGGNGGFGSGGGGGGTGVTVGGAGGNGGTGIVFVEWW